MRPGLRLFLNANLSSGELKQNSFLERFNSAYQNEVLDMYMFKRLSEVREIKAEWLIEDVGYCLMRRLET